MIELDKKAVLPRLKLTKSFHHLLRRQHLQFTMDHYDTSNKQLNYTHHVQLDYIKLNRSLIDGIEHHPEQRHLVETVCVSARTAGISIIASQGERIAELGPLFDAGIDYAKGNLVGEHSREVEHDVDARVVLGSLPSAPR